MSVVERKPVQTKLLWKALALAIYEAPGSVQGQTCPHWWHNKLKAEPGQWIGEETQDGALGGQCDRQDMVWNLPGRKEASSPLMGGTGKALWLTVPGSGRPWACALPPLLLVLVSVLCPIVTWSPSQTAAIRSACLSSQPMGAAMGPSPAG